tara:strand:+ start:189 stop:353 length:165 start_codon:yes stop_codon:yes gene_type:complete
MKFKNEAKKQLTINPKDYPNVSSLFGIYEPENQTITCPTCEGKGEILEKREEER